MDNKKMLYYAIYIQNILCTEFLTKTHRKKKNFTLFSQFDE